jgi:hypothetical protein
MAMSRSVLKLERKVSGWVDRNRAYKVIMNGMERAELRPGEVKTVEVDPGEVEIFLKIDWCSSRMIRLDVEPESEVWLCCWPRYWATALYGITFGRNSYMRLEVK